MKITKAEKGYKVESASSKGKFYEVDPDKPYCSCPAFRFKHHMKEPCKHITAVREHIGKEHQPQTDKVLKYVKEQGEVDSVELIEKFSEEDINRLIQQGELIENKGIIKILD